MTPLESMPDIIRYIMLGAPNTRFVIIAKSAANCGQTTLSPAPRKRMDCAIGTIYFVSSLQRFRNFLR